MPKLTESEKVQRATKRLLEKDPCSVIKAVTEGIFWPSLLEPRIGYRRVSDDTSGDITVSFSNDGDGWIEIASRIDPQEPLEIQRFREPICGGGESPRVRNALLVLALAIKLDNQSRPQDHRRKAEDWSGPRS